MKFTRTVHPKHAPILGLFLNGYEPMRRQMDESCRKALLEIAPLVFSKWYYTALAPDTILSPANIIGMEISDAEPDTDYAYHLRTIPAEEQPDAEYIVEYGFDLYGYSTEKHPLIDDLQVLIAYCTPDRATNEDGLLLTEEKSEILNQLSLKSDFYLEYLTRLAWMQGLFIPMPSIHTKRLQPSPDCQAFFAQSTAEMLVQLGQTACELTAERFMATMDMDHGIATQEFFAACLEGHQYVDQIFVDFYKRVDIDIEEIWKTSPDQLSNDQKAIVSSFLFTGIMLDKWFLTPMSVFFHFLRPIAFTPMRFFQMVNNLSALMLMEHNLGAELFTPPTYYSLTPLGLKLFAPADYAETDRQKMPRTVPYEKIMSAVEQEAEILWQEQAILMEGVPEIFSMKVTSAQDAELWKIIEVNADMDLHHFCRDLSMLFALEEQADYLLSILDQNSFPLEYSAKGSKRSINKTYNKTLEDLSLDRNDTLTLYPTLNKSNAFLIEVQETGKGSPYLIYPRIAGQSQKFIEQEKFDETF